MYATKRKKRKLKLTKHGTNVGYKHVGLAFHRLSPSDLMAKKIVATHSSHDARLPFAISILKLLQIYLRLSK